MVGSLLEWSRAALSQLPQAALVADARGNVVLANHAAEALIGRTEQDLIGVGVEVLAGAEPDEELARLPQSIRRVLATGTPVVASECALRGSAGSRVPLEASVTALRDASGEVLGAVATLGDRTGDEFFRFMHSAPDPIVVSRDGRILFANPAMLRLLGYSLEEVVARPFEDFAPPEELPTLRARIRAVQAGEQVPTREDAIFARDGSLLRIEVSSVGMMYRGRRAVVSIGRDVTGERRVEAERAELLAEIEAQRALFQAIFDQAPAGVAIIGGDDFHYEMVNDAYRAFAPGYSFEGKRFAELSPEMPELIPILERVMSTGEAAHQRAMKLSIRRTPDAPLETAYFTFSAVRVSSPRGRHVAILGMVVEATEEMRARARADALAEVARQRVIELNAIIETMSDAVCVCDRAGGLTLVNSAALRLLGVSSIAEASVVLSQQPAATLITSTDGAPIPRETTPLSRALAGESVSLAAQLVTRPDHFSSYVRANATPLRDAEGAIVGAVQVIHDVTELEQLDRLKDQFIRVAAHELKTPIAIMKGYAQALLRTKSAAPPRAMLEAIDRGADRLDRTARKLLDLSTLHLGRLVLATEDVDVDRVLHKLAEGPTLGPSKHQVRLALTGPLIARGDRERLEYVFASILDNAIRYSPGRDHIDIAARADAREIVVSIRDYGVGIPRERQPHIFERFFRAHTDTPHDYGGMGIDLYLSREVVTRMGGRIWFESSQGDGSTFFVALPMGGPNGG